MHRSPPAASGGGSVRVRSACGRYPAAGVPPPSAPALRVTLAGPKHTRRSTAPAISIPDHWTWLAPPALLALVPQREPARRAPALTTPTRHASRHSPLASRPSAWRRAVAEYR